MIEKAQDIQEDKLQCKLPSTGSVIDSDVVFKIKANLISDETKYISEKLFCFILQKMWIMLPGV